MDFKSVFNVSKLSDHELGHLEFILNSPSYVDVFAPYLKNMRNSLNTKLLDPSEDRKRDYNDDFLRGGILMIDGLLQFFTKLITETEIERVHRSQTEPTSEDQYQTLREQNNMGPFSPSLGHIVSDDGPYDPDTDY